MTALYSSGWSVTNSIYGRSHIEFEQNGFLKAEITTFCVSDFFKSDSFMVSKVFFQFFVFYVSLLMSRNDFLFFFVWMGEFSLLPLFVCQTDKAAYDYIQIFSSFNKSQYWQHLSNSNGNESIPAHNSLALSERKQWKRHIFDFKAAIWKNIHFYFRYLFILISKLTMHEVLYWLLSRSSIFLLTFYLTPWSHCPLPNRYIFRSFSLLWIVLLAHLFENVQPKIPSYSVMKA